MDVPAPRTPLRTGARILRKGCERMAINPVMRMALKALSYPDLDVAKTYPLERSVRNLKLPALMAPLFRRWDRKIVSCGREILTRVYTPAGDGAPGSDTLLFFHGGGWVVESIDTYNSVCAQLARKTGRNVISVEYRLAPEHPFPQGLEDCYAVAKELFCSPAEQAVAPGEITLIGDSAGANLAAAVSLMARDRGEFSIPRQILIYPATHWDHSEASPFPSVHENGRDYLLTSKRICEYMDLYKAGDADLQNPYFAPLLAQDLSAQPDTLVITAEFDPLRDEGEAYGKALRAAGNTVFGFRMLDALHGFFSLPYRFELVQRAYRLICDFLERRNAICARP